MKIIGKKINLRNLKDSDAKSIFENVNNEKIAGNTLTIPWPYKLEHVKDFIKKSNNDLENNKNYQFTIVTKKDDEAIGMISLCRNSKCNEIAELGYWLGEKYWGKGYMKEAIELMLDFGFNKLKLDKIYAGAFADNIKSNQRLIKAGLKKEGYHKKHYKRLGVWHDDITYGLLKGDYKKITQ